jgi:hypothetical protein
MRRLLHMVLVVCVLLCGAHVAEPVQGHDEAAHHALDAGPAHADREPAGTHEGGAAHAVQHHCPVAPDPAPAATTCAPEVGEAAHFSMAVAVLASLTRAPPLEPPAA